jgi:hypothetical protein
VVILRVAAEAAWKMILTLAVLAVLAAAAKVTVIMEMLLLEL